MADTLVIDDGAQTLTNKTITLGGDLTVDDHEIITTSNKDIDLSPNGTGQVKVSTELSVGDSVTSSNSTRALNLCDAAGVMRILRVSSNIDTASPGLELLHRTTSDGSNTTYWDIFLSSTGLVFRDRSDEPTVVNVLTLADDAAEDALVIDASRAEFSIPTKVPTYTVAGLPSGETGDIAYCSNGDAGSACLVVYDGSNWKVIALGATASAS